MSRTSFELEYIFKASPSILYQFLTTPACLTRWFCDGVDIVKDRYAFEWNGSVEEARLVESEEDERLRFRWKDSEYEDEYFEYRMYKSPVTNETILEVTDFCDEDELEDQKQLWESQIADLRIEIGG